MVDIGINHWHTLERYVYLLLFIILRIFPSQILI
jgi:hypothetical protein